MPEEFRTLRTQKKRGTFSPSSVVLRSSTTYNSQLQRVKPTPYGGSVAASLWELFLKLSKFQNNQISYFAFSYSMVCITELCGSDHRRFASLLLIFFFQQFRVFQSFLVSTRFSHKPIFYLVLHFSGQKGPTTALSPNPHSDLKVPLIPHTCRKNPFLLSGSGPKQ